MTEKSSLWIVTTGGNQHTEIHAIYIYIFLTFSCLLFMDKVQRTVIQLW